MCADGPLFLATYIIDSRQSDLASSITVCLQIFYAFRHARVSGLTRFSLLFVSSACCSRLRENIIFARRTRLAPPPRQSYTDGDDNSNIITVFFYWLKDLDNCDHLVNIIYTIYWYNVFFKVIVLYVIVERFCCRTVFISNRNSGPGYYFYRDVEKSSYLRHSVTIYLIVRRK